MIVTAVSVLFGPGGHQGLDKQQFFDLLPTEFNRQSYLEAAQRLSIPPKTAEKHIARFIKQDLLVRFTQNNYRKLL